jgi:hypothetical protein
VAQNLISIRMPHQQGVLFQTNTTYSGCKHFFKKKLLKVIRTIFTGKSPENGLFFVWNAARYAGHQDLPGVLPFRAPVFSIHGRGDLDGEASWHWQ